MKQRKSYYYNQKQSYYYNIYLGKHFPSDIVDIHIIDSDWDKYDVTTSFIIEEPYQKKIKKYPRHNDSAIYLDMSLVKGEKKMKKNNTMIGMDFSLIKKIVDQIKEDELNGDFTAIEELLAEVPKKKLLHFLGEEKQSPFIGVKK